MPVFASNFTANSLSGTVKVSGGTANIRLVVEPIAFEGTKQFVLKIRKDSAEGAVLGTTSNITIVDNSSIVGVTANTATVLEGNLVSFTITTANVPNNANVYFSVLPASANITSQDFEANTGRFTIVNNVATFALKANADLSLMDEAGETFKLQVRTVSPVGNIVFTTSNIAITDFSKGYGTIFLTPSAYNYFENDTMRFQLQTYNAANAVLYYSTTGGNAAASNFIANTGSFTVGADNFANITLTANTNIPQDETRTFQLQVRIGDTSGTVMATSDLVTIRDINLAPVIGTGGTLTRTGGYVIHTFTNPGTFTINKSANIQYLLVGAGGRSAHGGGGGGGVLYGNTTINTGTYPLLVGRDGGGNGMPQWGPVAAPTGSGGNTVFAGFIAYGGGGGGFQFANQGGSGGGGGVDGGGTNPGGGSVPDQGNPGAPGTVPTSIAGGGGGAGAGGSGTSGGNGRLLDITGTATYYGGGAGGRTGPGDTGTNGLGSGFTSYGGAGLRTGPGNAGNGIAVVRYVGANYLSLNRSASSVIEGGNITFTLTTLNVTNGTTFYYSITGPNTLTTDFVTGNTGTVLMTNNSNTLTLVATTPNKARLETLTIQIKADALASEVLLSNTFTYINVNLLSNIQYLAVAGGGGGGGQNGGGGGGAGGYLTSANYSIYRGSTYTITVGAGGGGAPSAAPPYSDAPLGGTGSNSTISSATTTSVIALGGGGGGSFYGQPLYFAGRGGSGGGSLFANGPSNPVNAGLAIGSPAWNVAGSQGYPGGRSSSPNGGNPISSGGGGGGAGGTGADTGAGGTGLQTSISGSATYYAGGGGGSGQGPAAAGGTGGGAPGGSAIAGTNNTGGGGGGCNTTGSSGGNGGSGIVIVRYPDTIAAAVATTGSPNVIYANANIIYRFWQSGTITF
jgi:hypothetical protein